MYRKKTDEGMQNVDLHIAYYTGKIDDVPHVPERCWATAGLTQTIAPEKIALDLADNWQVDDETRNSATDEAYPFVERTHPITGSVEVVHMPAGDVVMQATEFQNDKKPDERLVGGYFFIANGRVTPSAFGVRALAFNRTDEYAYYCKVQINFAGKASREREIFDKFGDISSDFLQQLMPELMIRLPDWPDIEANGFDVGDKG